MVIKRNSARKTFVDASGYSRFKNSGTAVHRWVAENKLGRPLRTGEVVHHKDRNKQNNSAGNLHVFKNKKAHKTVHKIDAQNHGARYSYKGK